MAQHRSAPSARAGGGHGPASVGGKRGLCAAPACHASPTLAGAAHRLHARHWLAHRVARPRWLRTVLRAVPTNSASLLRGPPQSATPARTPPCTPARCTPARCTHARCAHARCAHTPVHARPLRAQVARRGHRVEASDASASMLVAAHPNPSPSPSPSPNPNPNPNPKASMDGAARRRAVQAELRRWHPDKVRVRVKG